MWIEVDFLANDKKTFQIYGKLIFIAQKFEAICKEDLKMFQLICDIEDEKYKLLSNEHMESSEKQSKLMLAGIITKSKINMKKLNISENEIDILQKARKVRNWVAHEMTTDTIKNNVCAKETPTLLNDSFLRNVRDLVNGEYLVSEWSYYLHKEYEFRPYKKKEDYLRTMIAWFFEDD